MNEQIDGFLCHGDCQDITTGIKFPDGTVECSVCGWISTEDEDEDFYLDGDHRDDDGEPCNCTEQECGPKGSCPECKATWKSGHLSIVCGDHGVRCDKCNATFTCP